MCFVECCLTFLVDSLVASIMYIGGMVVADSLVVVLVVIPFEKLPAPRPLLMNAFESFRVIRLILQRLVVRFHERIVVGHAWS